MLDIMPPAIYGRSTEEKLDSLITYVGAMYDAVSRQFENIDITNLNSTFADMHKRMEAKIGEQAPVVSMRNSNTGFIHKFSGNESGDGYRYNYTGVWIDDMLILGIDIEHMRQNTKFVVPVGGDVYSEGFCPIVETRELAQLGYDVVYTDVIDDKINVMSEEEFPSGYTGVNDVDILIIAQGSYNGGEE